MLKLGRVFGLVHEPPMPGRASRTHDAPDVETPLIGQMDPDMKYPTLVMVADNPDRDSDAENQRTVDLQEVLNDILVDENRAEDCCPELAALLKEKRLVKLGELRKKFLNDFFAFLVQRGCEVEPFLSIDGDEVFLRVSFGEDTDDDGHKLNFVEMEAEESRLRLQTVPELVELLGVKQPLDSIFPMYTQFRRTLQERYEKEHKLTIFQKYRYGEFPVGRSPQERARTGHTSIFRTVDRVRLLGSMIGARIDLEDCVKHGLLSKYYPVHRQFVLEALSESLTIRNFFFTDWLTFEHQAEEIRNYWGERVAFYFLWVRFTGLSFICCLPLALLLSLLWYSSVLSEDDNKVVTYCGTALMLIGWSTVYVKFWQRHESHYLAKWDCPPVSLDEQDPPPADYHGEQKPAPFNENIMIRQASWKRQVIGLTLSIIATVIYLMLVGLAVASIFYVEWVFHHKFDSRFGPGMTAIFGSILLTLQITISGLIWNRLSRKLVKLENPRSEQDGRDSYIWKLFPFNLVGTYSSFFYTAFIRKWVDFPACYDEDCTYDLRRSLWAIIPAGLIVQVLFMLLPIVRTKYALWKELKDWQQQQGAKDVSNVRRSAMEAQAKKPEYTTRHLTEDYNRMMIQVGYFILFGSVSPAVLFILVVFVLIKVKIDVYKMCHIYRRPQVGRQPRRGIGEWNQMISILSNIGAYTAVGIPIFNVDYIHDRVPNLAWKIVLLLGVKEIADLIRRSAENLISDVSESTKLMLLRRSHVADRMGDRYYSLQEHPHKRTRWWTHEPTMPEISKISKLDKTHADWEFVEKEEDDAPGVRPNGGTPAARSTLGAPYSPLA